MHTLLLLFGGIGPWEILLIAMVALLLFGRRLPEVGRSLGKGLVEFKKGMKGITEEIDDVKRSVDEEPPAKPDDKPPK
ncbi:MAG: twin-arginine translocase TatA/TatE family subunit [Planctomycetes bacterium]|nr:twin-arginine translocase TatA/TatE family subunit [Planctomycetota bacterium]